MKVYRGNPAAARNYVEADHARVDDYYLAEGTGLAERFVATLDGVEAVGPLDGDGYEAWVAGLDPLSREPRGRVRQDASAVRFVEVVVNGPKTGRWQPHSIRGSPRRMTQPKAEPPSRSSGGWPSTPRRESVPGADRFRCPSSGSKQLPSGTTPPEPATRIDTFTFRSTRAYGPRASGAAYTPSASAT